MCPLRQREHHVNGQSAERLELERISRYIDDLVCLAFHQTTDGIIVMGQDFPVPCVLSPVDPEVHTNPTGGIGVRDDIPVTDDQCIVRASAINQIITRPTGDRVRSQTTSQRIVALAALDDVVKQVALKRVGILGTYHIMDADNYVMSRGASAVRQNVIRVIWIHQKQGQQVPGRKSHAQIYSDRARSLGIGHHIGVAGNHIQNKALDGFAFQNMRYQVNG